MNIFWRAESEDSQQNDASNFGTVDDLTGENISMGLSQSDQNGVQCKYYRVVSYDIGERNLGYCVADVPYQKQLVPPASEIQRTFFVRKPASSGVATGPHPALLGRNGYPQRPCVKILAIGLSDSKTHCSTARLALRAARIAISTAETSTGENYRPFDVVIVERQFRMNRRASMIETALLAVHETVAQMEHRRLIVRDAPPEHVAKAFCMKRGYRNKKRDAIVIADALMADPTVSVDLRNQDNRMEYDPKQRPHPPKKVSCATAEPTVNEGVWNTASAAMCVGRPKGIVRTSANGHKRDDMADAVLLLYWFAGRSTEFVNRTHRVQATRGRSFSAPHAQGGGRAKKFPGQWRKKKWTKRKQPGRTKQGTRKRNK